MHATIKAGLISDDDLMRMSIANPGWRLERSDDGELLLSPPTGTPGGAKSGEAFFQLRNYAGRVGGKAYDSNTGYKTPGGGVLSPDASWISAANLALYKAANPDDVGFWRMMPNIAIEVASPSDTWPILMRKIDRYIERGVVYAVAIDPMTHEVYERGTRLPDLNVDFQAIMDA